MTYRETLDSDKALISSAARKLLVGLCSVVMMCEGFDLVVYGNIIPLMMMDEALEVSKATAGNIGSMVFIGMLIGGVFAGRINQGRRPLVVSVAGIIWFSAAVIATSLAEDGFSMGLFRFLTGLGLGIVLPTVLALARSVCGTKHSALVISMVMAGIPVGGLMAALLVSIMPVSLGWRPPLMAAGALGLVVAVITIVVARGSKSISQVGNRPAQKGNTESWTCIFVRERRTLIVLCSLATLADLFCYYGVTTWLTQLMNEFNLPLQNSLQLMMALNIGAIVGSLLTALVSVSFPVKRVSVVCGIITGLCLLLISTHFGSQAVLFVLVVLVGACAISAQNLLNTVVSNTFPSHARSAALGITLGVGRLGAVLAPSVGGWILQAGLGSGAVFVCFAVASFAGALFLGGCSQKSIKRSTQTELQTAAMVESSSV